MFTFYTTVAMVSDRSKEVFNADYRGTSIEKVIGIIFKVLKSNNLLISLLQWSLFYASLMRTQNIVELQFIRTC